MKHLLTLTLSFVMLIAFAGFPAAQQKAEKKSQPTGVETKQPATGEMKAVDKASPKLMTAKVTQVNEKAKTFTVIASGKEVTFDASKVKVLPKLGDTINVTYTEPTGGGPLQAETVHLYLKLKAE